MSISGTSKATITQLPASLSSMPLSGQMTITTASVQLGSHQYQQPPASAQLQRTTGGGSSPQPQLRFSSGQMPLGGGQSAPQQISRRQDGVELRQRIQNLLMQGDTNQNSRGHTPSTQQQQQQVVSQFLTMNNPPKQQQPPLLHLAVVESMHSGSSTQRAATRLSNAQKQLGISPHMHTAPNDDESVKHGRRTHGIVAHGHTASANVPSGPFQQPIISSAQTIQRMLSEERSVPASTDLSGQQIQNTRIKYGFQENLNRRGSNGQSVQVLHPGVIGKGIAQGSNLLNKAAIVTTMLSSNHQQHTTSDSSKVNSQLLAAANMRQSLWLHTTNGAIKCKKVQEMVQSRQKTCQFCIGNNSLSRSSPKLMSSQYLCYTHYHDQLKTLVRESLDKKYLTSQDYYNSKIVSDIMYNENRHIVSVFKDYLIFDDFSEYLKRYYRDQEAYERLPKVFEFYEKYSKVFPNYVALPAESKYMFKNIERKQKLIDEKHQQMLERQERVRQEQDEAQALGVALDSSVVQRMRHSKNVIFGSQFINDLTELNSQSMAEGDDQHQSMLRQQSSKIFEMLHTIQSQAPAYQATSVMNQFLKSQNSRQNTQQQVNTAQSLQSHKEVNNLEHLISQLAAFDNRNDSSVFYPNHRAVNEGAVPFLTDISLSSSQGMSSFLQDFDLREGGLHPAQDHYRTYNPTQGAFDEISSHILHTLNDETTPKKLQGSRGSIEDSNRLITTISNRQSMPGQPRATPQQTKSNVASNRNSKHNQKKSSKNTPAVQIIPQNQWSNILLQSTAKKSTQPEQVRKVQPIHQQHFISTGSNNVYTKSNLSQQAQNLLSSSKATKQPTPKSRPSKLGTGNMLLSTGGSISSGGLQSNMNFLGVGVGGGGGLSISPPATSSQLMGVGAITVQHSNRLSHTGGRGSLHSADQNQQQVLNFQGATGNSQQQLINQHLSASSLKSGNQMLQLPLQQQQQMSSANGTGGRSSQVSLGSPLSHNSVITHQVTGSMSGGFQHSVSIPSQKAKAITQQILSQIPPGSSLKQIATAAAKANLAGNKQVESHSGKKTSSRGSHVGANQNLKPNIHISINPSTGVLMPRSGPQTKSNDLVHLTPTSVGAALSQGLMGSAGNSQTSMRISPDFSIQPNMVLSQSTGTVVGPGTLKKMPDISKSFKIPSQTGIVTMASSSSSKYVNPNSISQSIREAVNKLLPPQPKYSQMSASTHIQQTLKQSTVGSSKDSQATAPPQSIMMTNTAALFSKLFTTQKAGGIGASTGPQEDASDASSHQAVYSTRIPQKKNFSSPDDVQLRIGERKNQHAGTATQSSLQQHARKSANDFYGDGGESSQSASPNLNLGKQKMMVVLKGGTTSTNQPLTKARMDNSPQSTATVSNNYRKIKLLGSESSAEKEDYMLQRQYALRQQVFDEEPFSGVAEEEEQDDDLMIDERNDIYTAKGGGTLQVPVTAGTKSQSSLRGGGRIEGGPDGKGQNVRQQAVSATATSQVNTYNFKMPMQSVTANITTTGKRMSSSTSDKSQGSNLKGSNYGGSVNNANANPYQRVMTSFSTGTKKKVKAPPPVTIESVQPAHITSTSGSLGSKLYEKIKTGMQVALGHGGGLHSQTSNSGTSAGTPVITSQKAAAMAGKKKPSTIFTFNK